MCGAMEEILFPKNVIMSHKHIHIHLQCHHGKIKNMNYEVCTLVNVKQDVSKT